MAQEYAGEGSGGNADYECGDCDSINRAISIFVMTVLSFCRTLRPVRATARSGPQP